MNKELVVLVRDEILGTVTQSQTGQLALQYDETWQQTVDAFPLSLSMPLAQRVHGHRVIHAYINGLLPDDDTVKKAIARKYRLESVTPFQLAGAIGEDLAGAVQMVPRERLGRLKRRKGVVQIGEKKLAEHLDHLWRDPGLIQISEDAGFFSLAGMQRKKAVYWVNDKWCEPRGRTPSTHIIKPPIPWLDGQVENEHFCLRLASKLGMPTCKSQVVHIDGKPNIVVERYDRQRRKGARTLKLTEEGGAVVRLHQEDMCQATGTEPDRKYQTGNGGGPGMKTIMGLLAGSGSPAVDRARFMKACALNFILVGTDAHAKNYSVLIEHGRYRLAPLYDIISILPYDREVADSRFLAMSVGGESKWRDISLSNWQKAARDCSYSQEQTVIDLRELLLQAPDIAQAVCKECRKAGLTNPVLTQLASEIARRCANITKRYGL